MPKLQNAVPYPDFNNLGFVYLGQADDGTFWVRSVAGKWAQLSAKPMDADSVIQDFNDFFKNNQPATEAEIIADSDAGIVVDPIELP